MVEYIKESQIVANFKERTKDAALDRIAEFIVSSGGAGSLSAEQISAALKEREELGSTGFGNGIAIPHARIAGLDDFVVFFCISRSGVPFDSVDKKKVHIFCTILAPEDKVNEHLKVLASFSRILSNPNFRREILQAMSEEVIHETLVRLASGGGTVCKKAQKQKALFITLYYEEFLHDILSFLLEEDIRGASIIESTGMGSYVSKIPLFAGFLGFMKEDRNRSKTIVCVITEDKQDHIIEGIESITGDLDKQQGAMLMLMDLALVKGTMEIV